MVLCDSAFHLDTFSAAPQRKPMQLTEVQLDWIKAHFAHLMTKKQSCEDCSSADFAIGLLGML